MDLLSSTREALVESCRQFRVQRLYLFGSAADGDFDFARSDLDFLVAFPDRAGSELVGFLGRVFIVAILKVSGRAHRHWLWYFKRFQHEEFRFSHDHNVVALDGAVRDLPETLLGFANGDGGRWH